MSFQILKEDENQITPETLTPQGNESKEDECYSCLECSSNIEIKELDETNNTLSFECPNHGDQNISIKEYLQNMPKNTYLYNKCCICEKQQNQINNDNIFKYCFNCKKVICNNCIYKHNKNHLYIDNDKLCIKCLVHPKNNNKNYCFDCKVHLCEDCLKERKHWMHKKIDILEVMPKNEEINTLLNSINSNKNKINKLQIEKNNLFVVLEEKYNKNLENEKEKKNQLILENNKNLEKELLSNEQKCNNEIEKIKKKFEKEAQLIREKYNEKNEKDINDYNKKIDSIKADYKYEIKNNTISLSKEIEKYEDLLKINNIVYNTYNKYKENYFYNKNIINLFLNNKEKGNDELKEKKNNNKFIEPKNQNKYNLKESEKQKEKEEELKEEYNLKELKEPLFNINEDELQDDYPLGLDLGSCFSCIGVYRNGGVEILPNRDGDTITPSIVTILDENTILKGEDSLEYLVKNYDTSIYGFKRFIGRDYYDKKVQEEIKRENFPFRIIGDSKGKNTLVQITENNRILNFTLEEISSFIIRKLVDNAEKFLNRKVNKLVITAPAYFNDCQRECIKQAALIAGIEVIRIINEPTAAALAYRLQDKESIKNGKILVFDLGGKTFNVTILSVNKKNEENFEILSTKGNKFLGGEDFDNKLVNYFLENFCRKTKENINEIMENKKIIKNLKISCENVKKVLSTQLSTVLNITNFYKNEDLMESINRDDFEELC